MYPVGAACRSAWFLSQERPAFCFGLPPVMPRVLVGIRLQDRRSHPRSSVFRVTREACCPFARSCTCRLQSRRNPWHKAVYAVEAVPARVPPSTNAVRIYLERGARITIFLHPRFFALFLHLWWGVVGNFAGRVRDITHAPSVVDDVDIYETPVLDPRWPRCVFWNALHQYPSQQATNHSRYTSQAEIAPFVCLVNPPPQMDVDRDNAQAQHGSRNKKAKITPGLATKKPLAMKEKKEQEDLIRAKAEAKARRRLQAQNAKRLG